MLCGKELQAKVPYIVFFMPYRTRKDIQYGWNIFVGTYGKTFSVWEFDDDVYLGFDPVAMVGELVQKTVNNTETQNTIQNRKQTLKRRKQT